MSSARTRRIRSSASICAGLVILLHGDELAALTADTARIRTSSGALLTYYRRPRPGAVPLWEIRPP